MYQIDRSLTRALFYTRDDDQFLIDDKYLDRVKTIPTNIHYFHYLLLRFLVIFAK